MKCLNLPISMRNDPAYVYVPGLIQGPNEPNAKEAAHRHFLRPLITELETAYTRGFALYQTHRSFSLGEVAPPYQQVFRAILVAVLMDLKAARPWCGLLDVTSHIFCFVCCCWHKAHLCRTDFENWKPVDDEFLRKGSELWRDVKTTDERKSIESLYGTRYSEFWRLPYWKPSCMVAVEPMHTIFLILEQRFFRDALGLDDPQSKRGPMKKTKGASMIAFHHDFAPPPHLSLINSASDDIDARDATDHLACIFSRHSAYGVGHIHRTLQQPLINNEQGIRTLQQALNRRTEAALKFVCIDVGCLPGGRITKQDLIDELITWRKTKPLEPRDFIHIDSVELLERVQEVVRQVITPAWSSRPPPDIGLPKAGTLKADHWRTLFTIHLPLALLSLWKEESPLAAADAAQMSSVLETGMALSCASIVMIKNTLTLQRRDLFRNLLCRHVLGLQQNFPGFILPTHHLAFHLYDFMDLLSVVREFWNFAFEGFIGKIQRTPTNHVIGQYEYTILHAHATGASFRQWLLRPDCPPLLKYCRILLDKAYGYVKRVDSTANKNDEANDDAEVNVETVRDQPTSDSFRRHVLHTSPPNELVRAIGTYDIECFSRIPAPRGDYTIATIRTASGGNSFVCYRPSSSSANEEWCAGQIQHIFERSGNMFAAIKRSKIAVLDSPDPFAAFWKEGFEAKLVSPAFSKKLDIVSIEHIIGHSARWNISSELTVVLNLSRVCDPLQVSRFLVLIHNCEGLRRQRHEHTPIYNN
ncbi:hypothetical protein FB446DRAFT_654305 [Lentinula raphanica]|nr:hypothetical protein FB446DRAFT_654305 [Lentinula raphanica]